MTEQLEEIKVEDFLGNIIEAGALIIYPSMVGRSPRLTLAEVISVKITSGSYKYSIKVQPLADSFAAWRFTDWKNGERVSVQARPVTLHFADRIMVIT